MSFNEQDENGIDRKQVGTEAVKCKSCGSNMQFDPDTQSLYCEHCGSRVEIKIDTTAEEIDLLSGIDNDFSWNDETSVFRCDNCGAKVVLSKGETANSCPFCGTAHVEKTEELAGIKPNGVLPFEFGSEKASEYSKTWAKRKLFASSKFKKSLTPENVKGVYTPCFTFDSCTTSFYTGRIGKRHYRTVGSGKNRHTESYIVWKNISGTYFENFDDILITAGSKFSQKELNKLSPYDTNSSREYTEKYLLGFMAYHYDNDLNDCWGKAKTEMDKRLRKNILAQYSYDEVGYLNVSTNHEEVTYKYVMLPVYIGNYNYKKKLYNFFVNGTTGKVHGKTPVSPFRVFLTVVFGIALVALIIFLASNV